MYNVALKSRNGLGGQNEIDLKMWLYVVVAIITMILQVEPRNSTLADAGKLCQRGGVVRDLASLLGDPAELGLAGSTAGPTCRRI